MGWLSRLFRRRQEPLGAAVTGIPMMPVPRVVPASHVPPPAAPVVEVPVVPVFEVPVVPVPVLALAAPGPRVELGFRDGTALALAPGSEQAKALSELADVLTQRD